MLTEKKYIFQTNEHGVVDNSGSVWTVKIRTEHSPAYSLWKDDIELIYGELPDGWTHDQVLKYHCGGEYHEMVI